jgi:class 3 adenylate cyclase/tetratricopeptide (TPR) repeat protein
MRCSRCGRENPEGFAFCGFCTAPLVEGASTSTAEERKVVSVLFCDLVGSTARAEALDPEDVRALLTRYHQGVRSVLERHGGTVEKFIGDAVMALFGAPVAHGDDPERAVRAALAIRNHARADQELDVRIAVATGEALVSLGARLEAGEGMAAGGIVNTASRLQSAASVNGVLVDEMTFRATEQVIEYRKADPVKAKGKAHPVQVWEPLEARAQVGVQGFERGAPLVGRAPELARVVDALARARAERACQLVTLEGVPGIGKSRLVFELWRVVDADSELITWRQGRSLPYGDGVSLSALSDMVKAQANILETDTENEAEEKLDEMASDLLADQGEARRIARQLGPLVGVRTEADFGVGGRAERFAAWQRFFEALAERGPLVLVFEDLHWADDSLLDFVDHLVDQSSRVPMLVVATSRPELLNRRPSWGDGRPNAVTISLSPLSNDETGRLVAALLAGRSLTAETESALLGRAGGNPLYAEQFVRMVGEGDETADLGLPETVRGVIAARLDSLPPPEKELLRDAAVIGTVFWAGAIGQPGESAHVGELLVRLERKEFVRREWRSSAASEAEYAFAHALVRDVAYEQITRADRSAKHRRVAEWIEALGRPEEHAESLAHHYVTALELACAAGVETSDLEARAAVALHDAGDRALSLGAYNAAARFYETAVELLPPDDAKRGRLLLGYGTALFHSEVRGAEALEQAYDALLQSRDRQGAAEAAAWLATLFKEEGRTDRARTWLKRAGDLAETLPPSRAKAAVLGNVSRSLLISEEYEEAIQVGTQALQLAETLGLDELQAHSLINIGTARLGAGDTGGIVELERGIAIAKSIDSIEAARGCGNLAAQLAERGQLGRALEANEEARALAERFRASWYTRWLRNNEAELLFHRGAWDKALAAAEEVIPEQTIMASGLRGLRARIRLARDDEAGALDDAQEGVELARASGERQLLLSALSIDALVLGSAGRLEEAETLLPELLAAWDARQPSLPTELIVTLSWVLHLTGTPFTSVVADREATRTPWLDAATAVANGELAVAAEVFERMGSKPNEARARLEAARQLLAEDRGAEVREHCRRALSFYRSVGATRYLREAEELLQ